MEFGDAATGGCVKVDSRSGLFDNRIESFFLSPVHRGGLTRGARTACCFVFTLNLM